MSIYGILISVSILLGILFTIKIAKDNGRDPNIVWDGAFYTIVGGIIGARLYHVLDAYEYYIRYPIKILYVWNGGLGIYGALLLGLCTLFLFLKWKRQEILFWIDASAISLPLCQAIGRLANMANNENLGIKTNLPWGIKPRYDFDLMTVFYDHNARFHPVPLYESLLNLILFIVIFNIYKKDHHKLGTGIFIFGYMVGYGFIRFFLEFLKDDTWKIGNLNVAQFISILMVAIGILMLSKKTILGKK